MPLPQHFDAVPIKASPGRCFLPWYHATEALGLSLVVAVAVVSDAAW